MLPMIPNKYLAILTYSVIALAIIMGYGKYKDIGGYNRGKAETEAIQHRNDERAEVARQKEKEKVEIEYAKKIADEKANADRLAGDADRLRGQLSRVRGIIAGNPGVDASGKTTAAIASVLAGLFDESVKRGNDLATEAERYRIAGETCERQYEAVRNAK